jgi:hypothetical protein
MAATAVPVVFAARTGVAKGAGTTYDDTNGHSMANNGRTVLLIEPVATAGDLAFVIPANNFSDSQTTKRVVSVSASTNVLVGPFPVEVYGNTLSFTKSTTAPTGTKFYAFSL